MRIAAENGELGIFFALVPQNAGKIGVGFVDAGIDDGHNHVIEAARRNGVVPSIVVDIDRFIGGDAAHRSVVGHPPLEFRHVGGKLFLVGAERRRLEPCRRIFRLGRIVGGAPGLSRLRQRRIVGRLALGRPRTIPGGKPG